MSEPSRRDGGAEDRPDLSVIIVAWNVRDLVLQAIRHVYARRGSLSVEVILTDNGSRDGTVEAVRSAYPEVVVIANADNVGFPRSNNQGLRVARGRYILFLNSDTIVGEGTLAACVAELERDATVGMVTCRLMYPDGRVQYEAGRNPYRLADAVTELFHLNSLLPRHRFFGRQLMGDWDHRGTRDVEVILGAFMLVRRELALELGGLPEDLFMFHEDVAFCLRVRRRGYRIRYLGDVETLHLANQTTRKHRLRWYLLEGECRVLLVREAQGAVAAALVRVLFGARALVRLLAALLAWPIPGLGGLRARHREVFDVERQLLQLAWSIWPPLVRPLLPSAARAAAARPDASLHSLEVA